MKDLKLGEYIEIHAFKHNGSLHRSWRKTMIIDKKEEMVIVGNYHAKVIEGDGRNWFTQEPAVSFFFEDRFYNVIAMIKTDGIYFYCNLASPYTIDEEGLKYIDYDLDVRVKPDFSYVVLDEKDYRQNSRRYSYPQDLQKVIFHTLDKLKQKIESREHPFDHDYIKKIYQRYVSLEKET